MPRQAHTGQGKPLGQPNLFSSDETSCESFFSKTCVVQLKGHKAVRSVQRHQMFLTHLLLFIPPGLDFSSSGHDCFRIS